MNKMEIMETMNQNLSNVMDDKKYRPHVYNEVGEINWYIDYKDERGVKGLVLISIAEGESKYYLDTTKESDGWTPRNVRHVKSVKTVMNYIERFAS